MPLLSTVVLATFLSQSFGMMMSSFTKTDGSLDISGLANHIALMEQELKSKAAASDLSRVEAAMVTRNDINNLQVQFETAMRDLNATKDQLLATQKELKRSETNLKVTQSKLTIALEELEDLPKMKSDIADVKKEKTSMNALSMNGTDSQFNGALSVLKSEFASLKSEIIKLQNNTGNTSLQEEMTILKSEIVQLQNRTETTSLQADLESLKSDVEQIQNSTDMTDIQVEMATLKSEVVYLESSSETVSNLSTVVEQLQIIYNNSLHHSNGATYIRWGRTSCPHNSNTVYRGYAGGTWRGDHGGSSSVLCLPDHPTYGHYTYNSYSDDTSHIYGAEYGSKERGMMFSNLYNENVPCVVCQPSSNNAVIMVPAQKDCYAGWRLEYTGYLMGSHPEYASSDYICVDERAETVPGGSGESGGLRLYLVESKCGALKCPPYVDNWELTCSVCSK